MSVSLGLRNVAFASATYCALRLVEWHRERKLRSESSSLAVRAWRSRSRSTASLRSSSPLARARHLAMPPSSKRARTRSPSPALPLHLLTSLPSIHSLPPPSTDPALARLLPSVAQGLHAHEARLLDPHEWREVREGNARRADEDGSHEGRPQGRLVRWAGSSEDREVWTDRCVVLSLPLVLCRGQEMPSWRARRRCSTCNDGASSSHGSGRAGEAAVLLHERPRRAGSSHCGRRGTQSPLRFLLADSALLERLVDALSPPLRAATTSFTSSLPSPPLLRPTLHPPPRAASTRSRRHTRSRSSSRPPSARRSNDRRGGGSSRTSARRGSRRPRSGTSRSGSSRRRGSPRRLCVLPLFVSLVPPCRPS